MHKLVLRCVQGKCFQALLYQHTAFSWVVGMIFCTSSTIGIATGYYSYVAVTKAASAAQVHVQEFAVSKISYCLPFFTLYPAGLLTNRLCILHQHKL